jgi:hypothetical protein
MVNIREPDYLEQEKEDERAQDNSRLLEGFKSQYWGQAAWPYEWRTMDTKSASQDRHSML